jgi:hypothetical protein
VLVRTGAPDHRDDEVAWPQGLHAPADLHDLAQRLVADDEAALALRRRAVLEGANLLVRPAHAHLQDPELDVGGRRDPRYRDLGDLHLTSGRDDCDCSHDFGHRRLR